MGLFVRLFVQPEQIPASEWRDAFDESLELLQNYAIPLVGLDWEKTRYGERVRYSPVRLRKDEEWGEHWRVEGDAVSGEHGETFMLKRGFCDKTKGAKPPAAPDIVWAAPDALDYQQGAGTKVFNSKTQGYPFHYAMLAVGILIESRFPGRALVLGNITPEQARLVLPWANRVLKKSFSIPVVMDETRLWPRLRKAYGDDLKSALRRFSTLYCGPHSSVEALVGLGVAPETLEGFVEDQLTGYRSLDTIGAMEVVTPLFEAFGIDRNDTQLRVEGRKLKAEVQSPEHHAAQLYLPQVSGFIPQPSPRVRRPLSWGAFGLTVPWRCSVASTDAEGGGGGSTSLAWPRRWPLCSSRFLPTKGTLFFSSTRNSPP